MAQFLKKTFGLLVPTENGAKDPALVEVHLSAEEYRSMIKTVQDLKRSLEEEKASRESDTENCKSQTKKAVLDAKSTVRAEYDRILKEKDARIENTEAELDQSNRLKNSLLRITREQANAKRGLQPKKSHTGYRFSGKIMQTRAICGYERNEGPKYATVWTAILETPYDATIPIDQIDEQIQADLMESGILDLLDVNCWLNHSDRLWKGSYQEAVNDENPEKLNYLFDYYYMINTKTRLWEIQITTTGPIKAAEELLGRRQTNNSKKMAN